MSIAFLYIYIYINPLLYIYICIYIYIVYTHMRAIMSICCTQPSSRLSLSSVLRAIRSAGLWSKWCSIAKISTWFRGDSFCGCLDLEITWNVYIYMGTIFYLWNFEVCIYRYMYKYKKARPPTMCPLEFDCAFCPTIDQIFRTQCIAHAIGDLVMS